MPTFTYTGDSPMQFPADDGVNESVEVSPGDVVELDHNPDPAYFAGGDEPEPEPAPPAKAKAAAKNTKE